MGTTIKTSAISANGASGSLDLVVQAGTTCIETAGIDPSDIDLLISIGIYHDDNIVEPSMAALIQQRLGINLDPVKQGTMKFTFGFDLYNGACGFINALQVADAMLKTGRAEHILIVSADTHPSKAPHCDFPFRPLGAAVLLTHEADTQGFDHFFIHTSGNGYKGLVGGADMKSWRPDGIDGRKYIDIQKEPGFSEALRNFSVQSAGEYFNAHKIDLNKVDFLIASQHEKGFGQSLHDGIGLNGVTRIVDLHGLYGDAHTSSLPLGFHQIVEQGALRKDDRVLFAAVGSGLTSAFAIYTA